MLSSKLRRVGDPSCEVLEQSLNEALFISETREERQVDTDRLTRFTPPLKRESAHEAKLPTTRLADCLNFGGGAKDLIYVRPPLQTTAAVQPDRTWASAHAVASYSQQTHKAIR